MSRKAFCEICGKEYAHIMQHNKTIKHLKRAAEHEENTDGSTDKGSGTGSNSNEDIIKIGEGGEIITTTEQTPETHPDKRESIPESIPEPAGNGKITIVTDTPAVPEKSTFDKIMEVAFSEQYAPITISFIQGITERISPQQHNNNEVKPGQFRAENGEIFDRI